MVIGCSPPPAPPVDPYAGDAGAHRDRSASNANHGDAGEDGHGDLNSGQGGTGGEDAVVPVTGSLRGIHDGFVTTAEQGKVPLVAGIWYGIDSAIGYLDVREALYWVDIDEYAGAGIMSRRPVSGDCAIWELRHRGDWRFAVAATDRVSCTPGPAPFGEVQLEPHEGHFAAEVVAGAAKVWRGPLVCELGQNSIFSTVCSVALDENETIVAFRCDDQTLDDRWSVLPDSWAVAPVPGYVDYDALAFELEDVDGGKVFLWGEIESDASRTRYFGELQSQEGSGVFDFTLQP